MKKLFIFLLLACAHVFGQYGCGNTIAWNNPVCQTIAHGKLSSAWTVNSRHGEYAQSETECNIPSMVSVENSVLRIKTVNQAYTCGNFNANGTVNTAPTSFPYSTGDVQFNTFHFQFGTVTYRLKMPPQGTSTWPAIWMLGANCQDANKWSGDTGFDGCPNLGSAGYIEIDLTECFDGASWCQFNVFNPSQSSCNVSYSVDTNWHNYKLIWTSTTLQLFQDNSSVASCTISVSGQMFLIFQIQTGGAGGTPVNSTLPTYALLDYVRIQDSNGNTTFFDDFSDPVPVPMLRPLARAARISGIPLSPGVVNPIIMNGNAIVSGGAVVR